MNAEAAPVIIVLPAEDRASWELVVDTANEAPPAPAPLGAGGSRTVEARALVVLRLVRPAPAPPSAG